jgi:iron(III) transport system permease protein
MALFKKNKTTDNPGPSAAGLGDSYALERPDSRRVFRNRMGTYFSKPDNMILLILGIILSVLTIAPLITIVLDSFLIHAGGYEGAISGLPVGSYSFSNFTDLFGGRLANKNFWTPLANTMELAVLTCVFAILFGGGVAYFVTRTNMPLKKYISSIFILPYVMPQWTIAVVWKDLWSNTANLNSYNGLWNYLTGINMPTWWCVGLFPTALCLGIHYAPFAYILIGGVLRNMDANLEEAATILNTPKWKIFFRVTLPIVMPAVLSTILLVFSSAVGSYPVPHYLLYDTLATKYMDIEANMRGGSNIISLVMMLIGVTILLINQRSTSGRKQYTTVTGKSGQASKTNLGKAGGWLIATLLVILTTFTSIYPVVSFALGTFMNTRGDYTSWTTKWWDTQNSGGENGMYGQNGILYNQMIRTALGGQLLVAVCCALLAGTIGLLVGYAVAKNRKSKWANYVGNMAFLPYLLPSLSVGAAYFVFGSQLGLWNSFFLLILVGTIKYIPFASRASQSAMMQISGEIEESAIIEGIPWWKRMTKIIMPIQKSSILSGYLLPFITSMREWTLFMMLCADGRIVTTLLGYFDEMNLYGLSNGINLIIIVVILLVNFLTNILTGASLDKGIGGK